MAVHRLSKPKQKPDKTQANASQGNNQEQLQQQAMEQLVRIMNDTPTILKLKGTPWEIRGLKPAVQWLIAEEACKVVKQEKASMGDVIKQFAINMPSVARVITLALLNDKQRIENEYQTVYDTLMWGEYEIKDWATILFEIMKLIDVDFFFATTNVIQTVRNMTLQRKQTMQEQLSPEQNGGR